MLIAAVDGARTNSLDLDADQWLELERETRRASKKGTRLIVCKKCGGPVHPAKLPNPYLTQFFVHNPGYAAACAAGAGSGESPDHIHLKDVVFKAIKSTKGWIADVEADFDDVVFDVLASRAGEHRHASGRRGFEIQRSHETAAEVLERQEKRARHAKATIWLTRSTPSWSLHVPSCRVERAAGGTEFVVGGVVVWAGGADGSYIPADPASLNATTKQILKDRMAHDPTLGLIHLDGAKPLSSLRRSVAAHEVVPGQYAQLECGRPVRYMQVPATVPFCGRCPAPVAFNRCPHTG